MVYTYPYYLFNNIFFPISGSHKNVQVGSGFGANRDPLLSSRIRIRNSWLPRSKDPDPEEIFTYQQHWYPFTVCCVSREGCRWWRTCRCRQWWACHRWWACPRWPSLSPSSRIRYRTVPVPTESQRIQQCCGSGIRCLFFTPESGMGKKSRSGFRDELPGSYYWELGNNILG